jgi:hypothetical protein
MRRAVLMILTGLALLTTTPQADAQTVTTSSLPYTTPFRGATTFQTAGLPAATVVGYTRVQPSSSTTPSGLVYLQSRQNNVLVAEAGVPGTTGLLSGRIYVEFNGSINTAIVFANPNPSAVAISISLTDQSGNDLGSPGLVLNANVQTAKFVSEAPFGVRSGFAGTLTFTATAPIAVVALRTLVNEQSQFLFTPETVTPIPTSLSLGTQIIPHFADAGGWRTKVILVNPTDQTISGVVQFFGEGTATIPATPLILNVNGAVNSSFAYSIRPRSSASFDTLGPNSIATQVGSIQITPAGGTTAPASFAVLSFVSNGVTVSQTTVETQVPALALRSFVEFDSKTPVPGATQDALAIANTSVTPATVNFELLNGDGTTTGLTASITVPGFGHASIFVHELFPSFVLPPQEELPVRGVIRITSFSSIAVANFRTHFNELGNFLMTSTVTTNEGSPSTNAELFFPQILDGGGFATQFVLFSGVADQATTGTLRFVSQNGQALSLSFP